LKKSALDDIHLAPADIVSWGEIVGFNFTRGGNGHHLELEIDGYIKALGDKLADLTIEQLQRHKVRVLVDGADDLRDMWSVYDCIVWETALGAKGYVLFDGRWFEIADDYAGRVKKFVS